MCTAAHCMYNNNIYVLYTRTSVTTQQNSTPRIQNTTRNNTQNIKRVYIFTSSRILSMCCYNIHSPSLSCCLFVPSYLNRVWQYVCVFVCAIGKKEIGYSTIQLILSQRVDYMLQCAICHIYTHAQKDEASEREREFNMTY